MTSLECYLALLSVYLHKLLLTRDWKQNPAGGRSKQVGRTDFKVANRFMRHTKIAQIFSESFEADFLPAAVEAIVKAPLVAGQRCLSFCVILAAY